MKIIKKSKEIKHKNYYAAFLFFAIFWLAFLGFSGTLTSGYHLTDDHEIVRINSDLKTQSTLAVAKKWMKNDQVSTHRFRPLYFIHRVIEAKIFSTNFTTWSVYTACLAIFTSFFLFCFLQLLGFPLIESILFPFLVLVGPQASIWWRLGPNETLGMFLMSVTLFFLGLIQITTGKREKAFKALFVATATFMALSKESFLLLLPALILFSVYLSMLKNKFSLREAIKKNLVSIGALSVVFVGCILYIKVFIGTGGTGYAGVYGFDLKSYIMAFLQLAKNVHASIIVFMQVVLIVVFTWRMKARNEKVEVLKAFIFPVALFLAILIPQVILYAKSGFFERYLVPAALAYALAIVYLFGQIKKGNKIIWSGMLILTALFIMGDARSTFSGAQDFAQEGRNIGNISSIIKSETSREDNFLIVGEPAANTEWTDSINYYIRYELDRKSLYVYPVYKKASYSDFEKQLIMGFGSAYGKNRYENNTDKAFNVIILFPKMEKTFLSNFPDKELLEGDVFVRKSFGGYVIYYKNKTE